jgi:uncharacterized protein YdaU (DUF1376 family)
MFHNITQTMPKDNKPPAFQFYPDDFSSDGIVEAMTTKEVGAYILLLCKAWREEPPGSIPNDDRVLARWTRLLPAEWAECRTGVLAAFTLGTDSRLHQKRLRKEYQKLVEFQKDRSVNGKKGAEAKWLGHSSAIGSAINQPLANDGSSTSTSSSTSESHSLEAFDFDSEKEAMRSVELIVGVDAFREYGGQWTNRFRENPGKLKRVMLAVIEDMKRKKVKSPGGLANDLWTRFADN